VKTVSALLQLDPQFRMVVDFAVEGDDDVAILGHYGLIAPAEVDDFEPRRAQRGRLRLENALLVGSAMNQRADGFLDSARGATARRRWGSKMREAGNAAQLLSSLARAARKKSDAKPTLAYGCNQNRCNYSYHRPRLKIET
jgi:hypothetical protein